METVPSESGVLHQESTVNENDTGKKEFVPGKHVPVIEKPAKTFSIKDIIAGDPPASEESLNTSEPDVDMTDQPEKEVFSAEAFAKCWPEFIDQLNGEGSRIMSMFKSVKPELENDQTIRIHLSNATQKDTFVQNYKQRLLNYLQTKFILKNVDIETTIDNAETNNILYTDEQRYNYLFNKYPILKEMKKNFNLDIT